MGRMTRNAWPNSSKWPPNVFKKNVKPFSKAETANRVARITTLKLQRNLASQTTKNASTNSRKWPQNALKKNAKPKNQRTAVKINAKTTPSSCQEVLQVR